MMITELLELEPTIEVKVKCRSRSPLEELGTPQRVIDNVAADFLTHAGAERSRPRGNLAIQSRYLR